MRRLAAGLMAALLAMVLMAANPAGAATNGEETGPEYSYVGALIANYEGYGTGVNCSGTLIAPDVFLTAAHCVVGMEELGVTLLGVTFDPAFLDLTDPEAVPLYGIESIAVNPAYPTDGTYDPYTDIAVIVLSEPVVGIEPAQLPTLGQLDPLATQRGRQDTTFTVVGYGVPEMSQAGGQLHPVAEVGVRRFATTQLININHGLAGETLIHYTANQGGGKGGTCYGDSGGALFLDDSTTIIGVNSGITNKLCKGGGAVNYRLDTPEAQDFLDDFVTLPDPLMTETAVDETVTVADTNAAVGVGGEGQIQGEASAPVEETASAESVSEPVTVPTDPSLEEAPAEQAPPVAEGAVAGEPLAAATGQEQSQAGLDVDEAVPAPVEDAVVESGPAPVQDPGHVVEPVLPAVNVPVVAQEETHGQGVAQAPGQADGHGNEQAPGQNKEKGKTP